MNEQPCPGSTAPAPRTASSVAEVVANGLCIGCGLCETITEGRVRMRMQPYGGIRPAPLDGFTQDEEARVLSACPGVVAESRPMGAPDLDAVWGSYAAMRYAWAGDDGRRFVASSGGVLTALACHLLQSKQAAFILHVGPDPDMPMRSRWVHSRTAEEVQANAGSRYGPVAPLAGLKDALDRNEDFAIVAKPCDLGAVHMLSKTDPRIDEFCVARLAMVCGGQSRLTKSQALLNELGIEEKDVSLFRYRGWGCPGVTRVETRDGTSFERTYSQMWQDQAGWDIETRCKLCPDALGEAGDIVAADTWPDCDPAGEDEGFNGIIVRTPAGEALLASAAAAGDIVLGRHIQPREFDMFQPHQVRKKLALKARYDGLSKAGAPIVRTDGLRLDQLAGTADEDQLREETLQTYRRAIEGRFREPATAAARAKSRQ